jgi:methionyl-tRNA formyltransferase
MRLVFAGTPAFAATALEAILAAGHEVSAVFCQPDRPAGRGQKQMPGPVKQLAQKHGLPLFQPTNLKAPEILEWIKNDTSQVWVVAAYGLILPLEILSSPPLGCLNIHASLLPRWRGAAPIHRAIQAGDQKTGVAIMQMEAGLDTGPILLEESIVIEPRDTTETLHNRLADLGAQIILKALDRVEDVIQQARQQSVDGVLYAAKIQKEEAWLDWMSPAVVLERQIRAFTPSPGARFRFKEEMIKVGEAFVLDSPTYLPQTAQPGYVLNSQEDLQILTGAGVLRITRLQRPGGRMLPVQDFLAGCSVPVGSKLD